MLACGRSWAAAPPAALLLKSVLRAPAPSKSATRRFLSSTAGHAGSGSLYLAGCSSVGALGLGGDVLKVHTPTLVKTAGKVKDMSCGRKFTLFVTQVPHANRESVGWILGIWGLVSFFWLCVDSRSQV